MPPVLPARAGDQARPGNVATQLLDRKDCVVCDSGVPDEDVDRNESPEGSESGDEWTEA